MSNFVENLGRFLEATGPQNGHFAWTFARVDWPDDATRDDFIATLKRPMSAPDASQQAVP